MIIKDGGHVMMYVILKISGQIVITTAIIISSLLLYIEKQTAENHDDIKITFESVLRSK
jgi:hypothetical protein